MQQNAGLSEVELNDLGEKDVNGRQIKNVVKTASGLAAGEKQQLGYRHIVRVLDLMEEFDFQCVVWVSSVCACFVLTGFGLCPATRCISRVL